MYYVSMYVVYVVSESILKEQGKYFNWDEISSKSSNTFLRKFLTCIIPLEYDELSCWSTVLKNQKIAIRSLHYYEFGLRDKAT